MQGIFEQSPKCLPVNGIVNTVSDLQNDEPQIVQFPQRQLQILVVGILGGNISPLAARLNSMAQGPDPRIPPSLRNWQVTPPRCNPESPIEKILAREFIRKQTGGWR